jgi:Fe-S-cluster-containing dehydrogenase component
MSGIKSIIFRADKCAGCHMCELICSVTKNGKVGPRRARIKVVTPEPGLYDLVRVCIQCAEAFCMKVCPVGAIIKDQASGIVLVNDNACIGCGLCIKACIVPDAIKIDPKTKRAIKCDLCRGDPVCVRWCPSGALQYA